MKKTLGNEEHSVHQNLNYKKYNLKYIQKFYKRTCL